MSEVFDKAVKKGLAGLREIPSPFEVARKLGLNIPTGEDIEDILSIVGPQADIKAMVEESSRVIPALKKGDTLEAISSFGLAALAPFMIGIPGTVSEIKKGSKELGKGVQKGLRTVPAKADAPKVLTKTENTFNAALARQNPVLPINNDGTRKTMTELAKELMSRTLSAPEKGKFVLGGPDKQLVQKIKKVWELEEKMNAFYAKSGIPENIPSGEFKSTLKKISTLKKTPKGKKIYDELTEATEEMYRHGSPIIKEVRKGLSGLDEPTISPLRKAFDKSPASKLAEIPPQIDKTGLTAYHGTTRGKRVGEDFFDIAFAHPLGQFLGEGHSLSINPKRAEEFANIRASADLGFRPVGGGRGDTRYYSDELDTFTNTKNLLKGLDEKGKPFLSGQTIARFDVSKLEKPFIVDTNKKRLYAKRNIDKLKEEGYDSIIFKDFSDKHQEILVFPEHIKKVKSRLQGGLIGYK